MTVFELFGSTAIPRHENGCAKGGVRFDQVAPLSVERMTLTGCAANGIGDPGPHGRLIRWVKRNIKNLVVQSNAQVQ